MKRVLIGGIVVLMTITGAFAWGSGGNNGGGMAPGPSVGAAGGGDGEGGVGRDYRVKIPKGQDGPSRPTSNLKDVGFFKMLKNLFK